jgi:beta-lactam-binding protein with PASTA domain
MSEKKSSFFVRNIRFFALLVIYITLFLIVSTFMLVRLTQPAGKVAVPDVTGKQFTQVYNTLVQKELNPVLSFTDAVDIDPGLVLRQYPEAGKVVSKESRVKLVISRNQQKLEMPELTGEELVIARNKLLTLNIGERKISLKTGIVSYVPSEKHAENIVIGQSPKAGELVTPNSSVNLLVSMGSNNPEMTMPDITNQHIDLTFDLLLSHGVNIIQQIETVDELNQTGMILNQIPAPGAALNKGDTVTLTVAHFERDRKYYNSYERVSFIVPGKSDESPVLIEAWINDDLGKRVRYSNVIKPGEDAQFVFHRTGNAQIEIMKAKKKEKVIRINSDY